MNSTVKFVVPAENNVKNKVKDEMPKPIPTEIQNLHHQKDLFARSVGQQRETRENPISIGKMIAILSDKELI
jgi:hypothetical protein